MALGGSSSSLSSLILGFVSPRYWGGKGWKVVLGVNTAQNVVNGFPELWNVTRDPGEHQDALCCGGDHPWVSAEGFWRKRGKYPPSVRDFYQVSALLTPWVVLTH